MLGTSPEFGHCKATKKVGGARAGAGRVAGRARLRPAASQARTPSNPSLAASRTALRPRSH